MIDKMSALMYAAHNDDSDSVAPLLAAGMNPNAKTQRSFTPLMFAATRGDVDSVNLLLTKYNADPNVRESHLGMTALMFAAGVGEKDRGDECVRALCDAGSVIDLQDNMGATAIDWARKHGHTEIVKALQYEGYTRSGDNSYYSGLYRRGHRAAAECCHETLNVSRCCGDTNGQGREKARQEAR